jgi:hypothetical protein
VIEPELQKKIDERYSRSMIIYGAVATSALMMAVVGWFVVPSGQPSGAAPAVLPIWVLVFFLAVAAIVARRFLVRWERLRDLKLLRGIDGLLGALQANTIILAAIGEMIVIAGVISSFFSFDRGDLVRAVIIAAVVFALNFPRRLAWNTIVSNLKDV